MRQVIVPEHDFVVTAVKLTSTLAMAKTSAEAPIVDKNSLTRFFAVEARPTPKECSLVTNLKALWVL